MSKTLTLIIFFLISTQCTTAQQISSNKGQNAVYSSNMMLDVNKSNNNYYIKTATGENIVFEITSASGGDPKNDTQIKKILHFEIPLGVNSFNFDSQSLVRNNAFLERSCRCVDAGFNKVTEGSIKGKKTNGEWEVEIEVRASGHSSGKTYGFTFFGIANEEID